MCDSFDYANLSKLSLYDGKGNEIPVQIGETMKFDMTTRKQIDISAGPKELSSSFSASGCECDNMVMESHYKVYFAYEDLTDLSNPASSGTPSTPGGSTPGGANTPGGTTGGTRRL